MLASDFAEKFPGELRPIKKGVLSFVPNPLPHYMCSGSFRTTDERAHRSLGRLEAVLPTLPNQSLITTPFMRREAVLSSKIEGTRTELAGLYLFEDMRCNVEEGEPNDHDETDAMTVMNYVDAQNYGFQSIRESPICNRILCEMHDRLMSGIPGNRGFDKMPGKFRRTQAHIGDSDILLARYVAPPAEEIDRLMTDLEAYINSEHDVPTLAKIAMVHYQFEAIHPFFDGNGRIGRLLISLMLSKTGILREPLLYLSAYFERNKTEYVRLLLRVSTHGDWGSWISFFLEGVESVANDAATRAADILTLREKYRSALQSKRSAAAKLLELVDSLFRWPITTVKRATGFLEMSPQGATKHIQRLQQAGILEEVTGYKRNRLFMAKEIVEILS
ncbi:Fic family protein [bacterium]|nr:Fic family protein [bacterium]